MKIINSKFLCVLLHKVTIVLVLSTAMASYARAEPNLSQNDIILKGKYQFRSVDSVGLVIWDEFPTLLKRIFYNTRLLKVPLTKNGEFQFKFNSDQPVYFSMVQKNGSIQEEILSLYFAEPGDEVTICISNQPKIIGKKESIDSLAFKGKGAEKFRCHYQLIQQADQRAQEWQAFSEISSRNYNGITEQIRQTAKRSAYIYEPCRAVLDSYKTSISRNAYELMEADLIANAYQLFFRTAKIYGKALREMNRNSLLQFRQLYRQVSDELNLKQNSQLSASAHYSSLLLIKLGFESVFSNKTVFTLISSVDSAKLKERLVTEYFLDQYDRIPKVESTLDSALMLVNNPYHSKLLNRLKDAQSLDILKGNFQLTDVSGNTVKLSAFRGKVIFIDFWFTGCGGCSIYYNKVLSKVEKVFKDSSQVIFISVSIDKDKAVWLKSVESGKYTSQHAINLYTDGSGTNHPLIRQLKITSYPRPIIFGKEGMKFVDSHSALRTSVSEVSALINQALNEKPNVIYFRHLSE